MKTRLAPRLGPQGAAAFYGALLGDTLVSRGARVTYAETYRRESNDSLPGLSTDQLQSLDVLTVTSNEGLQNLYDLTQHRGLLLDIPLLVPGKRSLELARNLGFSHIIVADNATDDACIRALEQYFSGMNA